MLYYTCNVSVPERREHISRAYLGPGVGLDVVFIEVVPSVYSVISAKDVYIVFESYTCMERSLI
jgi:hypothetical protein